MPQIYNHNSKPVLLLLFRYVVFFCYLNISSDNFKYCEKIKIYKRATKLQIDSLFRHRSSKIETLVGRHSMI